MPPKKVDKGQQKAVEKAKQKVVEDKTFGLKNKNKSKAVQKFIRSVQAQATGGRVKTEHEIAAEQKEKAEAKKRILQQQALLASLYKGTENIKKLTVDVNAKKTDPRTIRAEQQIDLYVDQRAQNKKPAEETMDDWDMAKLEQVVKTKHGGHRATTDIVCKYFLDALEKRLYGWFWQCPNGEACQYKHCLPPGYVLKRKEKIEDIIEEDEEPIEELIERERAALPAGGTPVTLENFQAWKLRKEEEARVALEESRKKAVKEGRTDMSGRDLFAFNPSLFVDDEAAADNEVYAEDEAYWQEKLQNEAVEELSRIEEEAQARRKAEAEPDDEKTTTAAAKTTDEDDVKVQRADLFLDGGDEDEIDLDELEDD